MNVRHDEVHKGGGRFFPDKHIGFFPLRCSVSIGKTMALPVYISKYRQSWTIVAMEGYQVSSFGFWPMMWNIWYPRDNQNQCRPWVVYRFICIATKSRQHALASDPFEHLEQFILKTDLMVVFLCELFTNLCHFRSWKLRFSRLNWRINWTSCFPWILFVTFRLIFLLPWLIFLKSDNVFYLCLKIIGWNIQIETISWWKFL